MYVMADVMGAHVGRSMHSGVVTASAVDVTACRSCGGPLSTAFFRINGRQVCLACREKVAGSWVRVVAYGAGAAIGCAGLYYGLLSGLGLRFAVIPIVAGVSVGSAVRAGAGVERFFGMRLFAVVLTYLTVASTYGHSVLELEDVGSLVEAAGRSLTLPVVMALQGKNVVSLVLLAIGLHEAFVFGAPSVTTIQGPFRLPESGEQDGDEAGITVISDAEAANIH